ncbi:uncharacterized protein LOC110716200 isoform X3 [Chenopodium quinoa]|uniref:uncharacterized protein LOC110716200 isoform X3 n=1 Tax=Chenopodium quinoa TaxID=63459 RepID=UPI000B76F4F2|nr:uncharacterized protein LOC110716200 isoform X3 [Chenopodium quinoa]
MTIAEEEDLNISSESLPYYLLGNTELDFDEDGVAIGDNASLFSFFLGQQVRNKAVCPVQVKSWDEYTSEILDHLWACIMEKWPFDDPENRPESIIKHAQAIFTEEQKSK